MTRFFRSVALLHWLRSGRHLRRRTVASYHCFRAPVPGFTYERQTPSSSTNKSTSRPLRHGACTFQLRTNVSTDHSHQSSSVLRSSTVDQHTTADPSFMSCDRQQTRFDLTASSRSPVAYDSVAPLPPGQLHPSRSRQVFCSTRMPRKLSCRQTGGSNSRRSWPTSTGPRSRGS